MSSQLSAVSKNRVGTAASGVCPERSGRGRSSVISGSKDEPRSKERGFLFGCSSDLGSILTPLNRTEHDAMGHPGLVGHPPSDGSHKSRDRLDRLEYLGPVLDIFTERNLYVQYTRGNSGNSEGNSGTDGTFTVFRNQVRQTGDLIGKRSVCPCISNPVFQPKAAMWPECGSKDIGLKSLESLAEWTNLWSNVQLSLAVLVSQMRLSSKWMSRSSPPRTSKRRRAFY